MTRRHGQDEESRKSDASQQEEQILGGLASLRDHTAHEVMTPRVDVVSLRAPFHYMDVAKAFRRSGHSHFPVYERDGDHLLGVLFIKDLFHIDLLPTPSGVSGGDPQRLYAIDLDLTKRVREPFAVPESRNALGLLAEMRKLRRGFAVVVDEYGAVSGVITINDLVSELVGDIRDEYDQASSPTIRRIDQQRFLVDGACDVEELRDTLGAPIPDGEYVTLGGFLFDRFGRIPDEGDELEHRAWSFRVDRMDRRRIAKVVVRAPSATLTEGKDVGEAAGGASADGK
jgi:CBS domain containing-hemolysin-like protein